MADIFQPVALALLDSQANCGIVTQCGLDRALHVLYGAAGFLIVILLIVLTIALYFYRKNKTSEPKDL
jgi:hypothetical protein